MPSDDREGALFDHDLTRRRLLAGGAQGALALAAGGTLAGCFGDDETSTGALGAGKPVRGGTLTVGTITGGATETLNPGLTVTAPDFVRISQLYDRLFVLGEDVKTLVPALAESAEPNKDATAWTFTLRDGVTWHDGKPLTAEDVVYSIRSWGDPANFTTSVLVPLIDFDRVRARGKLTVEVPLQLPLAQFPSTLAYPTRAIIQNGTRPEDLAKRPVGTGPFKYVSFKPGSESVFEANQDYWEQGKPYVSRLVVNSSFTDEDARVNALRSGAVDASTALPSLLAKNAAASGEFDILSSPSNAPVFMNMRVDRPPFDDVRVRQAMFLIADRPALIDGAYAGLGTVGNDLMGDLTEYFASDLERSQDIEQAKSLLKAAGQENLTTSLEVAPAAPGWVESATLFAQQAKAAGVNVQVKQLPVEAYFTSAGGYLSRNFGFDTLVPGASALSFYYLSFNWTGANFNSAHYGTPKTDRLLFEAMATLDSGRAESLWREIQEEQFDQGGYLVFTNPDYVDGVTSRVSGLTTTPAGYFNGWRFLDGWVND